MGLDNKIDDEKIVDQAEEMYFQHPLLNAFNIFVRSENGIVTLQGKVDSKDMVDEAESILLDVPGIKQVINLIEVAALPSSISL